MITTLLFDLDETLLDFHKAEENAIKQTLLQLNIEPTPKTLALYSAINDSLWKLLEQGKRTREQLVIERFALLFAELKEDRSSAFAQSIYQDQLSQQAFLLPGARELLAQLQVRGVDLDASGLSRLEGQIRFVTDFELLALSDILNVSVYWLLTGEEKQ